MATSLSCACMMFNDIGGLVYVGKNSICLNFCRGVTHEIRINTKELLKFIESESKELWETDKFEVELCRGTDGELFAIITVKFSEQDLDRAVVYQSDLREALYTFEPVC